MSGNYSLYCSHGEVQLPDFKDPPASLETLFRSANCKRKYFMKNIRRFNSMFSFTSMGGKIDHSINRGNAPYVFRLSGQNYHSLGSLVPTNGSKPKFAQIYIYDTENENSNRQNCFSELNEGSTSNSSSHDPDLIEELKEMLNTNNVLVQKYRMVKDTIQQNPHLEVKLKIIGKRVKDGRTYNVPTASEVAALIVGDISDSNDKRDIVVQKASGRLKRISELHPCYLPLQYPLLYVYGEEGYRANILHRSCSSSSTGRQITVTMREYFAYYIQDRDQSFSLLRNSRRLYLQFLVDAYTMFESQRLWYVRNKQTTLRCKTYDNLQKVQSNGITSVSTVGQRVILPSSFTGGARYMRENYLDAMSLCKWFGYPDFFITVTCNPKWPEITRFLRDTTLKPGGRPDTLCRLFKIKLDALIKDLKDKQLFGKVQAVVYTIEFQKRGLPHCHICLFMHADYKVPTVQYIDPIISAEIPNVDEDPELYSLVSEFMIHGPCGPENPNCPCMKDNKSVVPYNQYLLKGYQAHINVEWSNQGASIKYLFKYINKCRDRATVAFVQTNNESDEVDQIDEVKEYYDYRYVSACEASWRIFGYDIHYRTPSVIRLPFHRPGEQQVVFGADADIDDVLEKPSVNASMFTSWFKCNQLYQEARTLNYVEFPTKFVWKENLRTWQPRQIGFSIGRIHSVPPNFGEAYFLRILLNKVKGPKSFEEIRTVNGEVFSSFRDACYAMGLLDDDKEYIEAIKEASHSASGYYLHFLFATLLLSKSLSRPEFVWQQTWEYLSDGILYNQQKRLKLPGLSLNEETLKNLTLYEIEEILLCNNSTPKTFKTMPFRDVAVVSSSNNRLITEELDYDIQELNNEFDQLLLSLTNEQRAIFDDIMSAVQQKKGSIHFVYGYGGTGKTFLWKTLSAAIRSKGDIVINVASSGIASLLLTGGRTAHSRLIIPLNVNEDTICKITPDSELASLLLKTSLIIWDEAPMVHRHAFEALDRTFKDVLGCHNSSNSMLPFGGKVIVFGGDFRQILPVVPGGSRQDIVNAYLSSSAIWEECKYIL